jgi:hypothetical protein
MICFSFVRFHVVQIQIKTGVHATSEIKWRKFKADQERKIVPHELKYN